MSLRYAIIEIRFDFFESSSLKIKLMNIHKSKCFTTKFTFELSLRYFINFNIFCTCIYLFIHKWKHFENIVHTFCILVPIANPDCGDLIWEPTDSSLENQLTTWLGWKITGIESSYNFDLSWMSKELRYLKPSTRVVLSSYLLSLTKIRGLQVRLTILLR